MTVPGVNLICAASFMAAIGSADRFLTSRKLVAYLGLDPKVRQSGEAPARPGRVSRRGSASARWALVEAAWTTVCQPGPLHAFYERTRGRRGHGKAIAASARKLALPFWCMLTRGEDYAHQQPSLSIYLQSRLQVPRLSSVASGRFGADPDRRRADDSPPYPRLRRAVPLIAKCPVIAGAPRPPWWRGVLQVVGGIVRCSR